ncbi:MAG: AAA family ATPase [Solirubrobacterales bacterium]|nr:AAA family ATPase [Solirubrobacterales bacterium]
MLFCDLVGFTAASDLADPEDVRARIRPYHSRVRREIEDFGGTVEKFIGDAVMAVFGAPVAHEDDPERAVRAGLGILDAISDLNEADAELGLQVRVGIETGEVIVAMGAQPERGESIVTGDVVNTASRLQSAAPTQGVAVGAGTYQATQRVFEYEPLAPAALKGKAELVDIFHAKAARSRFGTDLMRSITTPLVGRQIDLGMLTGAFQKAVQESTVQLVTIIGEPGLGKSRLVAELDSFVDSLTDLIRWRQGRCLPYGEGITFWALGEVVKAEAGILETDPPEQAAAKLDATIPERHPDAAWLRQRLRPLVGLEAVQAAREENFAAWRGFLELLAEEGPSVFVFEDLHWADEALLEFLDHVAGEAVGLPMLLVGTTRPELFEKAPTWAAAARNITRVNLSPLSEAETARLIGNLVGSAVLPADVQEAILARAGGIPLYAEEFVRLLKDRQMLTEPGVARNVEAEAEVGLPWGIQGLITARLDTLPAEHKRLLQDASVVGKVFWSGAVAQCGDRDLQDVDRALHELTRRELIRRSRRSSMEGQNEYAFAHALVRDVCYAQMPRAQRAERHRRTAAWIERVAGERIEDYAEILASHYTTALELALATREFAVADLEATAVRYLVLAGDRAMGVDVAAAERRYARALAMLGPDQPERADTLVRHGEALMQRARFSDAAAAYEQAIAALQSRGETRAAATAMVGYQSLLHKLGDTRYRQLIADAVAMLEPLGPSPELVQALTARAATSFLSEEHREAIDFAERAIGLAATLGLPEPARAIGYRGGARFALGDADGLADTRQALDLAVAQGEGGVVGMLHNNLAEDLNRVEGPRARLNLVQQGIAFVERRGMEFWALALGAQAVEALVDLGSFEDATAAAERLDDRISAAEDWLSRLIARLARGRVLARRGQLNEARAITEWGVERAHEFDDPQSIAMAFPLAAAVKLELGDVTGAAGLLSELEQTPNVRHTPSFAGSLPEAVRVAVASRDAGLGARLVDGLVPAYPLDQLALVTAHALLTEDRADHRRAAALFADAAERWARFEMPWEHGHALIGRGRCLLALGRSTEAAEALGAARDTLTPLGARPVLEKVAALLAQAPAATSEQQH